MAWCPKCENEYIKGITVCADCGTELVESLEEYKRQKAALEEKEAAFEEMEEESVEETAQDEQQEGEGAPDGNEQKWTKAYRNSAQKAEENKSSAYTLLFVGVLGFVAVVLILLGIIPLYQNSSTTKYLICGVMGVLFLLFIIFGIVSMRTFKILSVQAKSEDTLLEEITKWCQENLTAEMIDNGLLGMEEMLEEQKYFRRADKMKKMIRDKFMNLDEEFLDHFVDDYYQNLFEA
ncbi:MAG: hypothetical protein IJO97_08000 [Lachnospiraceae bacterium]|nr:hypothetical protein [Lachnospiraceae bacterium]